MYVAYGAQVIVVKIINAQVKTKKNMNEFSFESS
jgi:hypothetical protein